MNNEVTAAILEAAFFDSPGLLAVRFVHRGSGKTLAHFVTSRDPDVGRPGCMPGMGTVIGIGIVASFFVLPMLGNCSMSSARGDTLPKIVDSTTVDGLRDPSWKAGLASLADDLVPARLALRPWATRTLLDVPRELARHGDATGGWLKPRCSTADQTAFRQGGQLAAMLKTVGADSDLAVILDLPGPAAVAAAAAMSSGFDPVFTMDNLPHPDGVVPSAQTLGAIVYWRTTLMATRRARPADAPALFVLEGERLAPYRNEVNRFDNRSVAKVPDAAGFKALGVTRILYVRPRRGDVSEADDLNELFLGLATDGIEVRHLALESMDETRPVEGASRGSPLHHHAWFWHQYGWYRPVGTPRSDPTDHDARYRSSARPTMFSPHTGIAASRLDGGERHHSTVINRLSTPPAPPPSTSGGSWRRSFGSSSG